MRQRDKGLQNISLNGTPPIDKGTKPAIAAMHDLHSVFDSGHCTVIHCDAGGVSLADQ